MVKRSGNWQNERGRVTQSKLECYLALNGEYTVAEYLTWISTEDRLCAHCPQNEVETELHFLTSCQMYDHIRETYFPQITQTHKEFENKSNFDKLAYLLGELPQCASQQQDL